MKVGRQQIIGELGKRIIGQSDVIELLLLSLFVGGNSLIVGVPGLAKTLLVATLAKVLDLKFNRIQFTPDLMPSDITGTDIIQEDAGGRRAMVFAPGPIFANIVLADEINRTPPKTQSALLEAMQEHRVTIQGRTYDLVEPFFVCATQYLVLGAKARALTNGRYHVSYEDIRALAHPVLRHRVLTNFRAESEGITSDAIIDELLTAVPVPRSGM